MIPVKKAAVAEESEKSMKKKLKEKKEKTSKRTLQRMKMHWQIYLLIIPAIAWYILFAYVPMSGLLLAFKSYKAKLGILGSPWTGLSNFKMVFRDPAFMNAVFRTFQINILKLLITFPFPILLAVLFNEVRLNKSKKALQTIFTFPHFLSWIIVAGIMQNLLSSSGVVNSLLNQLFGVKVNFLANQKLFQPMLYATEIWKSAGYSAIIYMSAIAGIDQEQYEAAEIDGASRFQRIIHITIPSILPTISIMFILATGNLMSGGFDQIFNLANAVTKPVAETIDVYIYRITFQQTPSFGFSTAVSLFRSVVNLSLLLISNFVSKKLTGTNLIGSSS